MYEIDKRALRSCANGNVPRVVVWMGVVSLLTDLSAEMVACVLPFYLVMGLQFSPLQYGAVEAVQHGVDLVMRVLTAYWAGPVATG